MQCPRCQAQNREGVSFCEDCGARLALVCSTCGAEVVPPEKDIEHFYAPEVYRIRGELVLKQAGGIARDAESCFRRAIEVARARQQKSLELRAVRSLSRLLTRQGKREEARRMLAEIYAWSSEGFDTRDLREAKALLEEL